MLNGKSYCILIALVSMLAFSFTAAEAGEIKIGTINVQQVLMASKDGLTAKKKVEDKMLEYQAKFKEEEVQIRALQEEIDKKSSVWSEEEKKVKERELQKRMQEVELESKYATNEVKDLEKNSFDPILEKMKNVIQEYGKKENFSIILQARSGILYIDESLDVSEAIAKQMDTAK